MQREKKRAHSYVFAYSDVHIDTWRVCVCMCVCMYASKRKREYLSVCVYPYVHRHALCVCVRVCVCWCVCEGVCAQFMGLPGSDDSVHIELSFPPLRLGVT